MKNRKFKNNEEIVEILKVHKKELEEKFKVKKIGIFGSYVMGKQKKNSDIDFVVEFELNAFGENFKGLFDAFMELYSYLENLFGLRVDVLTPESIETIRIKEVAEEIKRSVLYV